MAFLVVLALIVPAAAPGLPAATAPVGRVTSSVFESVDEGGHPHREQSVTYRAVTEQRNVVRVEVTASDVLITDSAANLTAGSGCRGLTVHEVSCAIALDLTNLENLLRADAFAGDRDDVLTAVPPFPRYFAIVSMIGGAGNDTLRSVGGGDGSVRLSGGTGQDLLLGGREFDDLDGGPGRDVLHGGAGEDYLSGGPGRDVLHGGAGDDRLTGDGDGAAPSPDLIDGGRGTDTVSYRDVRSRVVVDLTAPNRAGRIGERDRLRNIEDVEGGHGDDLISGDAHANYLFGGPGADRLVGRGGPDGLSGDDQDRLSGGGGDDSLYPLNAKSLTCGPGQDAVQAPDINQEALVRGLDPSCEWFWISDVEVARRAAVDASGVHLRLRSTLDTATPISFVITQLNGGKALGASEASIPARSVTRLTNPLNAAGRRYIRRDPAFLNLIAESTTIGVVYEGPIECSIRL